MKFYKDNNCNKTNHNGWAMTNNGKQLIGFDFKHAKRIDTNRLAVRDE